MATLSDTPQVLRGYQTDPKRVFYSDINLALKREVFIPAGYGYLEPGTVLAQISESTNRVYQCVPYAFENPSSDTDNFHGAYLLQNGAASAYAYVTLDDSYKFAVGDHIAAVDSDLNPVDVGAITAIDRTTHPNYAVITGTDDVPTGITTAKNGAIFIQTATSSPYTCALGFLFGGVDTGTGEDAAGAQGVIILSNAMLYKGMVFNYDSKVQTDLSSVESGQFIVLK